MYIQPPFTHLNPYRNLEVSKALVAFIQINYVSIASTPFRTARRNSGRTHQRNLTVSLLAAKLKKIFVAKATRSPPQSGANCHQSFFFATAQTEHRLYLRCNKMVRSRRAHVLAALLSLSLSGQAVTAASGQAAQSLTSRFPNAWTSALLDRPAECPPCFDCHLPRFNCLNSGKCGEYDGQCLCPPGFGGLDCGLPLGG